MVDEIPNVIKLKKMVEQKATEMYENVGSIQEELGKIEVEGKSEGDLVKIIITGQHEMKKLSIDQRLLKESGTTIENSIMAAYKDAKSQVEELVKQKMLDLADMIGFSR